MLFVLGELVSCGLAFLPDSHLAYRLVLSLQAPESRLVREVSERCASRPDPSDGVARTQLQLELRISDLRRRMADGALVFSARDVFVRLAGKVDRLRPQQRHGRRGGRSTGRVPAA
jgi:hypothetical protein